MCKENKFKTISEGYCPCCGSSNVTHGIATIEDTVVSYPAKCDDCGATWNEDYTLNFCGVSDVYNREGERLGVVINLNGEEECPVD